MSTSQPVHMATRRSRGPATVTNPNLEMSSTPFPNFAYGSPVAIHLPSAIRPFKKNTQKGGLASTMRIESEDEQQEEQNVADTLADTHADSPQGVGYTPIVATRSARGPTKAKQVVPSRRSIRIKSRQEEKDGDQDYVPHQYSRHNLGAYRQTTVDTFQTASIISNARSDIVLPAESDHFRAEGSVRKLPGKTVRDQVAIIKNLIGNLLSPLHALRFATRPFVYLLGVLVRFVSVATAAAKSPHLWTLSCFTLALYLSFRNIESWKDIRAYPSSINISQIFNAHQGYRAPTNLLPAHQPNPAEFLRLASAVEALQSKVVLNDAHIQSLQARIIAGTERKNSEGGNSDAEDDLEALQQLLVDNLPRLQQMLADGIEHLSDETITNHIHTEILRQLKERLSEGVFMTANPSTGKHELPVAVQAEILRVIKHSAPDIRESITPDWKNLYTRNEKDITVFLQSEFNRFADKHGAIHAKSQLLGLVGKEIHQASKIWRTELDASLDRLKKTLYEQHSRDVAAIQKMLRQSRSPIGAPDKKTLQLLDHLAELSIGEPDFALQGVGAVVDPGLTSPSLRDGWYPFFNRPNSPARAITEDISLGNCWHIPGAAANLAINLKRTVIPTSVTIQHSPWDITIDRELAPKEMEFWVKITEPELADQVSDAAVMTSIDSNSPQGAGFGVGWIRISQFRFDYHRDMHIGQYKISDDVVKVFRKSEIGIRNVIFVIKSNWGGKNTCLYRVRVHGIQVSK